MIDRLPFFPAVRGFALPATARDVPGFMSDRKREAAEKKKQQAEADAAQSAELKRMAEIAEAGRREASGFTPRLGLRARSTGSFRSKPATAVQTAVKPKAPTRANPISVTSIYEAINAPHYGRTETPTASAPRSFRQIAQETYGFLGGGEGSRLIPTSERGGAR